MVKKINYESMDFYDKSRATQRRSDINEIMDMVGLPRYLGDLYIYEVNLNIKNEPERIINALRLKGLLNALVD
jgi:hypothetical protein